jgi:hypothetical protein
MGAIAQRHEWQQRPIVIGGGVTALVDAKPPLDLGASRVVEVDDADEGDEAGSPSRACTVRRRNRGGHGVEEKGRGGDDFGFLSVGVPGLDSSFPSRKREALEQLCCYTIAAMYISREVPIKASWIQPRALAVTLSSTVVVWGPGGGLWALAMVEARILTLSGDR